MKLTKKLETEIWQVYDTWLHSYLNGDVETYNSFLDDDYHFIGSATKEEFLNRKDTTKFFEDTGDQFAGKTEIRNESKIIEQFGELIFITHVFDAWFLHENEWNFYSRFRFSSILIENKDGWRFIYQHFSIPDPKTAEGETIGYDKINEENQELREAIQRRTTELEKKNRELEVETALERIRAQAVAMKESSDLLDIVVTMRNEFIKLGHEAHYFWHMMWLPSTYEKAMTSGDGSKIGFVMELPRHIHGDIPLLSKWEKSKKPTVVYAMNTQEAIDYVDKMVNLGDFRNIDSQAPTHDDIRHIGGLTFIMARTSHGEIGYSLPGVVKNPPKEDVDILVKFAGAFDLAHQRFLDLQKAEKQAREVQIELALEKVRSRTMGMQRSAELRDTALLLFQQVEELGISSFACGFNIWDDDKKFATAWMAGKDRLQPPFRTNSNEDVYLLFHEAEKRGDALFVLEQEGKELEDHYKYMVSIPEVKALAKAGLSFPTFQIIHCAYFSKGYLMFITHEPVPDAHDIFIRFAKVFEQTYTRFLDLQKAEAQARESEIELALERVRARTMAMQHSDELQEASFLLDQQVRALGIKTWGCAFNIYGENESTEWFGNEAGVLHTYKVPREGIFKDYFQKGQNGESLVIKEFKGKECVAHYEYMSSLPIIGDVLKTLKETNNGFPTYQIDHVVFFKYGYLLFITREEVPNAHDIFKRFAKVFEQTYTRFLDLQKAEAQAREAQIEAALEKVRSRSLAMHNSHELNQVVAVLFERLKELKVPATAVGIAIAIDGSEDSNAFVCGENEEGLVITNYRLPFFENVISKDIRNALKKKINLFVGNYSKAEKDAFYEYLFKHSAIKDVPDDIKRMIFKSPTYTITMIAVKNAVFNINDFEGKLLSENELDIITRFAKVFDQTYTRFLDLQKAEAQAREAQIETALERVRSRSMAMHSSEELTEAGALLYQELSKLGIKNLTTGYTLFDETVTMGWNYGVNPSDGSIRHKPVGMNHTENKVMKAIANSWKKQEPLLVIQLNEKDTIKHQTFIAEESIGFPISKEKLLAISPERLVVHTFNFKQGYLLIVGGELLTVKQQEIVTRFAKVFQQTYTRFLDLQRAETQAREARIEMALEKVRSRTMAMQHSDELPEAANTLFLEVQALGIPAWSCGYNILSEDKKSSICNMSSEGELQDAFVLPLTKHKSLKPWHKAILNKEKFFVYGQKGKDLIDHYKYMESLPELQGTFEQFEKAGIKLPTQQFNHLVRFNEGFLLFITYEEVPEAHDIFKRFGKVFEQTYTRFLDLKKAEAQARESEIELALERVRARTMAMQKSEEIGDVAFVLFQQLKSLGGELWGTGFGFCKTDSDSDEFWFATEKGIMPQLIIPNTIDPAHKEMYQGWKNNLEFLSIEKGGKDLKAHYKYMLTVPDIQPIFQGMLDDGIAFPKWQKWHAAYFKYGYLLVITTETYENEDIFKRFAKVFEQSYTRFLDLQKAEAQAKEAQIETALERIRSRSMAMQKSSELLEAGELLWNEITKLGIDCFTSGYVLMDDMEDIGWNYTPNPSTGKILEQAIGIPHKQTPPMREIAASWKKQEPLCVVELTRKQTIAHQTFVAEKGINFPFSAKELVEISPKEIVIHTFNFKQGYLLIIGGEKLAKTQIDIMLRFTKVFQQTYTRFLDLQKAEAQAREAQIETALERVRSQSMGMQSTADFGNVTTEMFNQLRSFGEELFATGIVFCDKHDGYVEQWHSIPGAGMLSPMIVPVDLDYIHQYRYDQWKAGKALFSIEIPSDFIEQHFENIFKLPSAQITLKDLESRNAPMPEPPPWEIDYGASFNHGYILVSSLKQIENTDILPRFAKVFEQTYTRFLDLKKAEIQAREAQIETALERVRSRSMAMHNSEELKGVVKEIFDQMANLDINADHAGIVVDFEPKKDFHFWVADNQDIPSKITVPYLDLPWDRLFTEAKKKGKDFFKMQLNFEEKNSFYKKLLPHIKGLTKKAKDFYLSCPGLAASTVLQKDIGLYIENFSGISFSDEENDILMRFGKVFQQAYTRFLDLKKAEAQAREAQIEASLERVRARAMAMHDSNELDEVLSVLCEQFDVLGIYPMSTHMTVMDFKNNSFTFRETGKFGDRSFGEQTVALDAMDNWKETIDKWIADKATAINKLHFPKEQLPKVWEVFHESFASMPDGSRIQPKDYPNGIYHTAGKHPFGYIGMNQIRPATEEEEQIVIKFANEFGRAYQRFLDLKKAESQTREAQINLAVERVRAKALAMHKSEDILEVVSKLKAEVMALEIPDVIAASIFLNEGEDKVRMWDLSSLEENNDGYQIPFDITFKLKNKDPNLYIKRLWENHEDYFLEQQDSKDFKRIIAWLREQNETKFANEVEEFISSTNLQLLHHAIKKLNNGKLVIDTLNPASDEMETILTKMGAAFDLAYKRFEDLQKAEAQTREAQIEAALEKIRSRSLAMHTTDELQEIVALVAEKLKDLGVIFDAGGVILCTYFPDNKDVMHWIAADDFSYSGNYLVPYFETTIFKDTWKSKNRGDDYFSKEFSVIDKNHFFKYAFEHSDYKHFPDEFKQHALEAKNHRITAAWSKNSAILIPSFTEVIPSESDAKILKRFAKVFEQAYIRFMDLQKAEERARETQIDIALERVRSRAMAMHQSDELSEAAELLYQEFSQLGVEPFSCGYLIYDDENNYWKVWMTDANDQSFKNFWTLPYDADHHLLNRYKSWKKKEAFHSTILTGNQNIAHHKVIAKYAPWKQESMGELPKTLVLSSAHFTHGHLLIVTSEALTTEVESVLTRFATVFDQTYIRFLDLKKAERQALLIKEEKERLEITLNDLQATQKQLIQSEKMASLGELTAGIAHEIQNPLNFVNNFSEVSKELLDEMLEEIEAGDMEEVRAIMADVIQNLDKINHHGKRADGIVKGMLQHSRASGNKKEATDINLLTDEYFRLAYHGLRAKDKSFNANLETDYDENLKTFDVIPQDIGRVILNLFTNAFYAVDEKSSSAKASEDKKYAPTVSVSTKKLKDKVTISVKDNGNGIPKHIIDKIFQPFFTTKPTGKGTGLGLSMSYDIIKAHGGELLVNTVDGESTEFVIHLPITESITAMK